MQRPSPTKVILDTDPGVDDALALLLAFASPELQVVGVTTVCGNVPVGQATKNLFRLLNVVQPPPGLLVGQGAARPLEEDLVTAVQVHGSDGLGELDSVLAEEGRRDTLKSGCRLCSQLPRMFGMNVSAGIPMRSR
jgi:inosine-uridine nucleoside N-ribohydrolase